MLVLLVEDHRLLAETLIDYLETESIDVDYAANGLQGLEIARTQSFDAIILDVNLP
jgi:DNA-binding response OmpR family regulator